MPAPKKPRYASEKELKEAVVAACLEELMANIRQDSPTTDRAEWTTEESKYLTDGRGDPEHQEELEAHRQACALFLKVREAILEFDAWAREIEATKPKAKDTKYYGIFQTLAPALLPLARGPHPNGNILGEGSAACWRIESAPPWEMSHREHLVFTVDIPLLAGTNIRFDALGWKRPMTDRELALITLSAGHFPRIDLANDTVAEVINRERKTMAKVRREIWLKQTDGRNIGPNQPNTPSGDPGGNTEAEP